jgi:hypothetical protein
MQLVEIKKNHTGTGLLIENEGYIAMDKGENKKLYESIRLNESLEDGGWNIPKPFVVSAVFQKFDIENANGRIYPEAVLKAQVEKYQEKIADRRGYGETNHPEDSSINLSRIGMNIIELHWEGHTLVGQIEIPVTEGFRKFGIVSTTADEVANLLINNLKIGVSSRGVGSVAQKYGKYMVGEDYELICWDVVSDPSAPNAWISTNSEELQQYVESKTTEKNTLLEKLNRFNDWLIK